MVNLFYWLVVNSLPAVRNIFLKFKALESKLSYMLLLTMRFLIILFLTGLPLSGIKARTTPEDMALRSKLEQKIAPISKTKIPYPKHMINCLADMSELGSVHLVGFDKKFNASFWHGTRNDSSGVYLARKEKVYFLPLAQKTLKNNHSYKTSLRTNKEIIYFPFMVSDGYYTFASMSYLKSYTDEFVHTQFDIYPHNFSEVPLDRQTAASLAHALRLGANAVLAKFSLDRKIQTLVFDEGSDRKTLLNLCMEISDSYKMPGLSSHIKKTLSKLGKNPK